MKKSLKKKSRSAEAGSYVRIMGMTHNLYWQNGRTGKVIRVDDKILSYPFVVDLGDGLLRYFASKNFYPDLVCPALAKKTWGKNMPHLAIDEYDEEYDEEDNYYDEEDGEDF